MPGQSPREVPEPGTTRLSLGASSATALGEPARLTYCRKCRARTLRIEPPGSSGVYFGWCENENCGHQEDIPRTSRAISLTDFLSWEIPPRAWLVEGLVQERDSVMVHAYRGIGKSRFVHGLAVALASGGPFLRYSCPEPCGVLLVDGELPREELQAMLSQQVAAAPGETSSLFKLLAVDLLHDPLPSLGTHAGQERVEAELDGVSLVILDNISTLCGGTGPENEAESWESMQQWLLNLRRLGLAVVLVHHEGKGGLQRGTSKREDILSQVVQLKRPADYNPAFGCQFEVHLTKARGVFGEAAEPFEAELRADENGQAAWTWRPLEDAIKRQVLQLHGEGLTQRDIAKELGIGLSTVNRKIKLLREEGSFSGAGS